MSKYKVGQRVWVIDHDGPSLITVKEISENYSVRPAYTLKTSSGLQPFFNECDVYGHVNDLITEMLSRAVEDMVSTFDLIAVQMIDEADRNGARRNEEWRNEQQRNKEQCDEN